MTWNQTATLRRSCLRAFSIFTIGDYQNTVVFLWYKYNQLNLYIDYSASEERKRRCYEKSVQNKVLETEV